MSCRLHKMYSGHSRLCVCVTVYLSVYLSLAACPHYCMDPDVTWGNFKECPLVVLDLQLVHGFRCYDNTAPNAKCQWVLY